METIRTAAQVQMPDAGRIVQSITLDLAGGGGISPQIKLVQYDTKLPVVAVHLKNGQQPYALPDGAAANVRMTKTDGKGVYNPAYGISADRHTAYVEISAQMTACAGLQLVVLEIVTGDMIKNTQPFALAVTANPLAEETYTSSDEYNTLASMAAQATAAAGAAAASERAADKRATDAAKSAEDADRTANSIKDSMAQISENKEAVSKLKEDLVKKTHLFNQKTFTAIEGYYNADLKGIGTLVTNLPQIISTVEIHTIMSGNGQCKCELLNANDNVLATAETKYNGDKLVFSFNNFYAGDKDELWVRVYSDTVLFARNENTINTGIVNTDKDYAQFYNNGNWTKGKYRNYILTCILHGYMDEKTIAVGTDQAYAKLIDAVKYANSKPNHAWNLMLSGNFNIYEELGGDEWYKSISSTNGNTQGIVLHDNVNLLGVDNVTLTFNPPDSLATATNVPNVSALELSDYHNKIHNISIVCKNCRYGIHDDTNGSKANSTRELKNVSVVHNGVVTGTWESPVSYGCGTSDNSIFEYENCQFNNGWLAHQNESQTIPPNFIATNCIFSGGSYAISLNTSGSCKANITFNNCYINYMVRILETSNIWSIYGSGNNNFNYTVVGDVYAQEALKLTDKVMRNVCESSIDRLVPVSINSAGKFARCYNANEFIGVSTNGGGKDTITYAIKNGYINTYGFSNFSGGDKIGIGSDGTLVVDEQNPIGVAVVVDGINQIYIF